METTYKIKNKCKGADFNSYVFVLWLYYYKTCNILDMPVKALNNKDGKFNNSNVY